jgi:hypothetical protein
VRSGSVAPVVVLLLAVALRCCACVLAIVGVTHDAQCQVMIHRLCYHSSAGWVLLIDSTCSDLHQPEVCAGNSVGIAGTAQRR